MARWLRISAFGLLAALALLGVLVAAVVGPVLRDDAVLDWVVIAVALDWRDFGEDAAMERLQYELDHQRIGMHVSDDNCRLEPLDDGGRSVTCDWGVALTLPGTDVVVPMSFRSSATVDAAGRLL
jgi:hypothetical protein